MDLNSLSLQETQRFLVTVLCLCAVQVMDGLRRRTRVPQPPAPRRKDGRAVQIWAREWLTQRQLVCQAINDIYKPEVMKCPKTPEGWNDVAKHFASKWNYFNCVGALDGKHIAIKKPKGGGSQYFSYKKFHSIVLMSLSDAKYKFLLVDVGAGGGAGDGRTWQKCNLARVIPNNRAGLSQDRNLPNDNEPIPFHIVTDEAFALNTWLMKPYSHQSQDPTEQIYSYRLSRARRVVENALSLLQMR
ncbi:putative nuclease HARBI1 [Macrobrachium nipponense]|uniref:putative nuclease HARBI1 n=1 Tax=Macrobrachium nipponense TaxID=159736 RepID=UPI0030C81BE6